MESGIKKHALIRLIGMYLLVFVLVGVLVQVLYTSAVQVIYDNTLKSGQDRISDSLRLFSEEMTKMLNISNNYAATDAYMQLKSVKNEGQVQHSIYLLQARNTLRNLLSLESPYIKQIYALFKDNDIFVSDSTSALNYETIYGTILYDRTQTMSLEEWKALHFFPETAIRLCAVPGLYSPYSARTDSYILCIVKTDKGVFRNSDVIVFMIDADELAATLAAPEMTALSRVTIRGADGGILYERGAGPAEDGYLTISAQAPPYDIAAEITVPKAYFDRQLDGMTRMIRLYIVIGIAGVFVLLAVILIQQYKPISSLVSVSARYNDAFDGKNSYDFIESAIQSVASAKNEADRRLALMKSASKNTLIYNALRYGSYTNRERSLLSEYMGEIAEGYAVLEIRAEGQDEAWLTNMENQFRERFGDRFLSVHEGAGEGVLIVAVETEERMNELYEAMNVLYAPFLRRDMNVKIGMSERMWGTKDLHEAYQEACYALEGAVNRPATGVARFAVDVEPPQEEYLSPSMLLKLSEMILAGSENGVSEFFDEAHEKLEKHPLIGAHFQRLVDALGLTIQYAASALGRKDFAVPEYLADEAPGDAMDKLRRTAAELCREAVERRKSGNDRLRQEVLDYISMHYSDPGLCAESVAQAMGVSRNGVYRFVQEAAGCTLAEYVENIRMEQVERLLSETGKGADEIAVLTGFGSINTLYRVFKKRHGIPPGAWRKDKNGKN